MLVFVLALPAAWGQDDAKGEKKPLSAKEQFSALQSDFMMQQRAIVAQWQKAKGDEQKKQMQLYQDLGKDFADKFFKLAEDNPKDPVATDALFWVLQFGRGSPVFQKANDKVAVLLGDMPLKDLARRLQTTQVVLPAMVDTVLKRAEKDAKDPAAADLLAWVAIHASYLPAGQKAAAKLVENYPDHRAIEELCANLAYAPNGADTLKQILAKASRPSVKATAAMSMGRLLANKSDQLGGKPEEADKVAAEADKYLSMVIDQFGKDVQPALLKEAQLELKALRTLRVGKEAPDIAGADLDDKQFKLSDYRGKVVLLDFWGNW
jgi:hypothetical protein